MSVSGLVSPSARPVPTEPGRLRSYRSYVNGEDVDGGEWVYVVSARALLDDAFASLRAKRRLEREGWRGEELPDGIVARVAKAGYTSIERSLVAASSAVAEWSAAPLETRILRLGAAIRDRIVRRADEIVDVLITEGHPRALARWQVSGMLECFGEESLRFYLSQMCMEYRHGPRRIVVRRQPDGVVCLNPPQNAPLSSALLGVTSIMAGNALVVRAPRSMPLGVMYVLRDLVAPALAEVGAPPGTLNVVCGDPVPVLDAWLDSPVTDDIMYFGTSDQGLRFQERCIAAGKKPILELAGNDVVAVWRDADLDYAAEALTESFFGSGQLCMIPNQVIVHPAVADELLRRLLDKVKDVRPGYPDDPDVLLTPVLRNDRFFGCLRTALDGGARLVCGGHGMELDGTASDTGVFLAPTVVRVDGLDLAARLDVVRHETFFPLLPVVVPEPAGDDLLLEAFVDIINSNAYGLRNSVWARDRRVVDRFRTGVRSGGLLKINDSHIGFLPYLATHGGTGLTGGVFGEANYPILRTSHLQGVSESPGVRPRDAVFGAWRDVVAGEPVEM